VKITKYRAVKELQNAWSENPLAVIAVTSGAIVAISKLMDATAGVRSKRAYARKMDGKKK
jgi:hypothetical protein